MVPATSQPATTAARAAFGAPLATRAAVYVERPPTRRARSRALGELAALVVAAAVGTGLVLGVALIALFGFATGA
jgi:hypothetical protein